MIKFDGTSEELPKHRAASHKVLYAIVVETLHWTGSVRLCGMTNGRYRVESEGMSDGFLVTEDFDEAREYYRACACILNSTALDCLEVGQ